MKIQAYKVDAFIQNPPAALRVALVYGPDTGLMRERATLLSRGVVADLNDPFNVSALSADAVINDPARLFDEANAISMMGGRRLVRIEDGRDALAPALKDYLKNPNDQALIVIEAGDLGPRSLLRLLCEKADNAAALPCYVEEARDIAALARSILQNQGYGIAPDALGYLSEAIAGDRARARSEIEKLLLYMGADKQITLDAVIASCGEVGEKSMDELIAATAGGKPEAAFAAYTHLLGEDVSVIGILRMLQNHFRRLHLARARMEGGEDPESIMKTLSPPVFFKQTTPFRAQMHRWSLPALEKVLQRLAALEAQSKQTGVPAETLCGQAILGISKAA